MDKDQLYAMVSEIYQINKNSFLPADFCYNRTNESIDFEKHTHLFERLDDGRYLVLGEDYPYSGPVYYRRRGETEDSVRGIWTNGLYEEGAVVTDVIELRFNDLFEGVKNILKTIPATIAAEKNVVSVRFQELLVCGVSVEEEVYKIFNAFFKFSSIPTAVIVLGNPKDEIWLTTALTNEDVYSLLCDIYTYGRRVYFTESLKSKNFMPESYDKELTEVDTTLDKYETRELQEIAEVINGKNAKPFQLGTSGIPYRA
ncbi:TPA: hypothetical protein TU246_002072 [Streptococcus equi subsp. zooepidemicus]|nr:hypothetical protein [Streptococcus equi subsp. zooepidemicus]HEL0823483.1 hypothetical protein [Streptococcus equi subsp. zooepidemicus]HEL1316462.1 hypothetical protein [Streptococcus equi subsp. zooepidemicus]